MYQSASASCGFWSRKFSSATTKSSSGTASLCPTDRAMVPVTGAETPRRQEPKVMFCVRGAISPKSADAKVVTVPFLQGLMETGYVEGQNVAIEYRWAE